VDAACSVQSIHDRHTHRRQATQYLSLSSGEGNWRALGRAHASNESTSAVTWRIIVNYCCPSESEKLGQNRERGSESSPKSNRLFFGARLTPRENSSTICIKTDRHRHTATKTYPLLGGHRRTELQQLIRATYLLVAVATGRRSYTAAEERAMPALSW